MKPAPRLIPLFAALLTLSLAAPALAQEVLIKPAPAPEAPPVAEATPAPEATQSTPVSPPPTQPAVKLDPWGNPLPTCDNIPPTLYGDSWITGHVDEGLVFRVQVSNMEFAHCWKDLEIDVTGLPRGAEFKYYKDLRYGEVIWTPGDRDTGAHTFTARVRAQGFEWFTARYDIQVSDEWETFFMPGIQYVVHMPANSKRFGTLHGVSVEYLLAAWIHRNDNRGPSHGRVYVDIDLLQSTEGLDPALAYHLGLQLSMERNPKRNFAIPFFGAESGGVYQGDVGNVFQVTPLAGLHLWSDRNLFINVVGGYLFPFSDLEELRGWRVRAGLNVSFW